MEDLRSRVAFVTGGASGIGLGIARACLDAGMRAVLADLRADHIEEAVAALGEEGHGESVRAIELDVTDRAAYARVAGEVGPVDVLVNNAGVGILGALADAGYDDWDWGLGVNLGGVVNGIQTFLPGMRERGRGHIVNTSSAAAVVPIPNASIYIAAKSAVMGLSEAIRGELAPEGIGVSVLFPGPVQTNIRESARNRPERFRRDSGYAEFEQRMEERPNSSAWMDPRECGRRVLEGIRRNDLFIVTHPEFRDGARERFEALLASFPDEPVDEGRAQEIAFLLRNPIYRETPDRPS